MSCIKQMRRDWRIVEFQRRSGLCRLMTRRIPLLILAAIACAQPSKKAYSITGRAVDRFTEKALAGVEVTLEYVGGGHAADRVISDPEGRFLSYRIPPGRYILSANAENSGKRLSAGADCRAQRCLRDLH